MAGSRRLFVGLEVPPEVGAAVEAAFAPWRAGMHDVRWVPPENLHVTVRFLGPVRPERVDQVAAAAGAAAATGGPFPTGLDGVGAFPSPMRARVLWAGLDDRAGRMAGLAQAMDAAFAPAFPPEGRAFRPHLTVGRCDPPAHLPAAFGATQIDPVSFEVVRVVLFESVPGRGGPPRYEALAEFPLTE